MVSYGQINTSTETPISPLENLTPRDIEEMRNYPGVITEVTGNERQHTVLSLHIETFFESITSVTQTKTYKELATKAKEAGLVDPEVYVLKEVVKNIGARATKWTSMFDGTGQTEDTPQIYETEVNELARAIEVFGNNLSNLIEGKKWKLDYIEDSPFYRALHENAIRNAVNRGTVMFEINRHRYVNNPLMIAETWPSDSSISTRELAATELSDDLKLYTEAIELEGTSNFERAEKVQTATINIIQKIAPRLETVEREQEIRNLPEIIILPGVGQTQDNWQQRIDFYKGKGIKCRYIEWPEFKEKDSFESQAEWLYTELKPTSGQNYSFEAHSRGGLAAWWLLKNHPEIADHLISTSAPTRSNEDIYPYLLPVALKAATIDPEGTRSIFNKLKGPFTFFSKINWQEAFRVYRAHIGEHGKSQWDDVISNVTWTIPKFLLFGQRDSIVEIVGKGAARKAKGAYFVMNEDGGHDVIGNHESSLDLHIGLHRESVERRKAVLPTKKSL